MGYISNQWLLSVNTKQRYRFHRPIKMSLEMGALRSSFQPPDAVAWMRIIRGGGDYKVVYLSKEEVDSLLQYLIKVAGERGSLQICLDILRKISNASLLKFLGALFSHRDKNKRSTKNR